MTTRPAPPLRSPGPLPWPVVLLVVLCALPELVLLWVAYTEPHAVFILRRMIYALGAFQPDLFAGRGPLFPGQSLSMFVTYGVLHTGPAHLILNMIGLIWLGRLTLVRRSAETFLTFYLMTTVGAAEVFALIGPAGGSMVGASGALFGLLGIYLVDNALLPGSTTARLGTQVSQVLLITLALALADLASSALLGTAVAWQAHAGGFFTGAVIALLAPPQDSKAV